MMPELPDHKHCFKCGKMLPPYQMMCVRCVDETMIENSVPREPYYISQVDEILKKPKSSIMKRR